jgi:hypothetical protein
MYFICAIPFKGTTGISLKERLRCLNVIDLYFIECNKIEDVGKYIKQDDERCVSNATMAM